jgi:hypothetical protein
MPARYLDGAPPPGTRSGLLSRRSLLLGFAAGLCATGLAGCATSSGMSRAEAARAYGPVPDERFPIPAVDLDKVDPEYWRRTVRYDTDEAPGTIIVDPGNYFVYRIEEKGHATRYGANVGRSGFLWSGNAYVGRKAEWPIWTPTPDQIGRDPSLVEYAGGMAPGAGFLGAVRRFDFVAGPVLTAAFPSCGQTLPAVPDEAVEVVDQIDHADLDPGAVDADGADEQAHPGLPQHSSCCAYVAYRMPLLPVACKSTVMAEIEFIFVKQKVMAG